jgi:hypothetical protein
MHIGVLNATPATSHKWKRSVAGYVSTGGKEVTKNKMRQSITAVSLSMVLAATLVACDDSGVIIAATPETGAAAPTDSSTELQAITQSTVSGRVADGYIQGATVCLDLNNSDSCDTDEPSAITGQGGIYTLEIPPGSAASQVIADIPATAIDEDTGTAIGQALIFSSPVDRPEFISPITTLIQQAVRSNPALQTEDAEKAVKADLGIGDDDGMSLFQDYVAVANDEQVDEDEATKFRYLHETARVVASLMKDIESEMDDAAEQSGIDVVGDDQTRRAIRELVRTEVRELLPQIAEQVSQIVSATESTVGEETDAQPGVLINSDQIAQNLRPTNVTENLDEKLESIVDRPARMAVNMQDILAAGLYWLEMECDFYFQELKSASTDATTDEDVTNATAADEDLTSEDTPLLREECFPGYGFAQLDDSGENLVSTFYSYDKNAADWVESFESEISEINDFSLVEGEWVNTISMGPDGSITFKDDGSATVKNESGEMILKAVSQALDGVSINRFFWQMEDFEIIFQAQSDSVTLFNSGSEAYNLAVNRTPSQYVMFFYPEESATENGTCIEFGNNCNVLKAGYDSQYTAVESLNALREMSTNNVELAQPGAETEIDTPPLVELSAEPTADGNLPTEGKATWTFNFQPPTDELITTDFEQCDPEYLLPDPGGDQDTPLVDPGEEEGEFAPKPDNTLIPPRQPVDYQPNVPNENDNPLVDEQITTEPGFNPDTGDENDPGPCPLYLFEEGETEHSTAPDTLTSTWRMISQDGISMIEIDLPIALRHDNEVDGDASMLLIEHEGYVRIGARIIDSGVESVVTYNEAAFVTLKSAVAEALASQPNR